MRVLLVALSILLAAPAVVMAADDATLQRQAVISYLTDVLSLPQATLGRDDMRKIIVNGTEWIMTSQEADGHFQYEYEPFKGTYRRDDNTVRQAGTFYVMAEVYRQQAEPAAELKAAIQRSISYFDGLTATFEDDGRSLHCVRVSEKSSRCDLGTTDLALLGLLSYVAAEPDTRSTYHDMIEGYKNFIVAAKRPGTGFSSRYYLDEGFNDEESPFFTGEAMLALARYYRYDPDAEVKQVAENTFSYLKSAKRESPLYLWMMSALKEMQQLWPSAEKLAYAKAFTTERAADLSLRKQSGHNTCAVVEGYASAYSVLEPIMSEAERARHKELLDFWLRKSARLQLDAAQPYRLVISEGKALLKKLPEPTIAHGGFLTGREELTQRIDFTQHCVNAYLQTYSDIEGWEL